MKAPVVIGAWHTFRGAGSAIGAEVDTAHLRAMRQGSENLLAALWRVHPNILLAAEARGRLVVHP